MSRARKKKEEMSGISLGVLSSGALAGAERSEGERSEPQRFGCRSTALRLALAGGGRGEGERSEPQRSGAAAKAGAGSRPVSPPDSEVVAKAKRRTYTARSEEHTSE